MFLRGVSVKPEIAVRKFAEEPCTVAITEHFRQWKSISANERHLTSLQISSSERPTKPFGC